MHSQNCTLLPNKKRSSLNSSLPSNIGLLRNFSSQSLPKFDSYSNSGVNIKPIFKDLNPIKNSTKTANIMDFVYSFSGSPRMKSNRPISTEEKSRHNLKQIMSNYNTVPPMPFVSSHLVGGFVGSKSQLGRRPTHGFGVNMWDIIRELLGVFGSRPTSANIVGKDNIQKNYLVDKKCPSMKKINYQESQSSFCKNNVNSRHTKLKDTHCPQKHSYADVAKIKLHSNVEEMPIVKTDGEENTPRGCNSMLEHISVSSESPNRNRIASECSIDSEDSFIVFEYCEGDDISIDDDDSCTSDDDSVMDLQLDQKNKVSCTDNESVRTKASCSTNDQRLPRKRVQFAKGKDLVQVHTMIKWNYAYRAARRGPWEMLARDSERFRCRIANTEAILSPILDSAHRETIFQQRFSAPRTGN